MFDVRFLINPPEIDDKEYINGLKTLSTFLNPNKMFKPRPSSL